MFIYHCTRIILGFVWIFLLTNLKSSKTSKLCEIMAEGSDNPSNLVRNIIFYKKHNEIHFINMFSLNYYCRSMEYLKVFNTL